jgi:NhaP-type Na+/H+ or K+/H+ antiporter
MGEEHSEEHQGSSSAVLFTFLAFLVVVGVRKVRTHFQLPSSLLYLSAGILLRTFGSMFISMKGVVELWDKVDHTTILLLFMPALIFEATFATEWYTFKRVLGQISILATSVVLLSASLNAAVIKLLLGYSFTWAEAMLIGTALAATDHVAVVAQLKEVQADRRFEIMIEGETLLNEGTVMVLFFLMYETALGGETDINDAASLFLRLSGGGLALGAVFAVALSYALNNFVDDFLSETNLTIAASYLLFWTAEQHSVHVSGALATVTLGLYMSAYGKTLISPSIESSLHSFWSLAGANIEAIIFMVGGMLFGMQVIEDENLTFGDFFAMLVLFILVQLIRFLVIAIHYPLLSRLGYGLTKEKAIVLALCGLKGVISTALSLMIYDNKSFSPKFRSVILFFTVSISALTIAVNSILIHKAVIRFKLQSLSQVSEKMLVQVTGAVLERTDKLKAEMKHEHHYSKVNWQDIERIAGSVMLMRKVMGNTTSGKQVLKEHPVNDIAVLTRHFGDSLHFNDDDLKQEMRRRYLTTLKGIYWHEFEQGQIFGVSAMILINSANMSLDDDKTEMKDWDNARKDIFDKVFHYAKLMSSWRGVGGFFRNYVNDRMIIAYDVASSFIHAHKEAEELVDAMEIDFNREMFLRIMDETKRQVEEAEKFLHDNIEVSYPEVSSFVQTKKACYKLLYTQKSDIDRLFAQGVIGEQEYEFIITGVDSNIHYLLSEMRPTLPTFNNIIKHSPLFETLSEGQISQLLMQATEHLYTPDDGPIIDIGQANPPVILLLRGNLKEFNSEQYWEENLAMGDFVGLQYLLKGHQVSQSCVQAVNAVQVIKLPYKSVKACVSQDAIWRMVCYKYLLMNRSNLGRLFNKIQAEEFKGIVKNSTINELLQGQELFLHFGGILLSGQLTSGQSGPYFLRRPDLELQAVTKCRVLCFNESLGKKITVTGNSEIDMSKYELRHKLKNLEFAKSLTGLKHY